MMTSVRKLLWLSLSVFLIGAALVLFFSINGIHETFWIYPPYVTMEKQTFTVHEPVDQPLDYVTSSGALIYRLAPHIIDEWHVEKVACFAISLVFLIPTVVLAYLAIRPRMRRSRTVGRTIARKLLWLSLGVFLIGAGLALFFSTNGVHETTWVYRPQTQTSHAEETQTFVIHAAVHRGFYYTGPSGQLDQILPPRIRDDWHVGKLACMTVSIIFGAATVVLAGFAFAPR